MRWITDFWDPIWPNLAANILWLPTIWISHIRLKHHTDRLHQRQMDHITREKEDG